MSMFTRVCAHAWLRACPSMDMSMCACIARHTHIYRHECVRACVRACAQTKMRLKCRRGDTLRHRRGWAHWNASLCICLCTCQCTCLSTSMQASINTHASHLCMHMYIRISTHISMCICIYMFMYMLCTSICVYTNTACLHKRRNTYLYRRAHTCLYTCPYEETHIFHRTCFRESIPYVHANAYAYAHVYETCSGTRQMACPCCYDGSSARAVIHAARQPAVCA